MPLILIRYPLPSFLHSYNLVLFGHISNDLPSFLLPALYVVYCILPHLQHSPPLAC